MPQPDRRILLLAIAVAIGGCAQGQPRPDMSKDYVGATFSEMQATFGDDYRILDVRNGYKRVRWVREEMVLAGGSGTARSEPVTAGRQGATVSGAAPRLTLPETTTLPCIVDVAVSPDGIVVGFKTSGAGCEYASGN